MTGIQRIIGMTGISDDQDGKGDYDEPSVDRDPQSQNKVSYTSLEG